MKKLITVCLLLATTFTCKAQALNFEETVKYINDMITCCSKDKNEIIKAKVTGEIAWGTYRYNFFDLVP